jgi:hypothetical protein
MNAVGRHFSAPAADRADAEPTELLGAIDAGLTALTATNAADRTGIAALVGLRRNLFPAAPPFTVTAEAAR